MFALASKSGIVHDFEIYIGKGTIKSNTKLGLSGDIVVRLSEIIPKHKNYKLSFDNWFTSYNLVVHLKCYGILSVGTMRSNRLSGCQFESDKTSKSQGEERLLHKLMLQMPLLDVNGMIIKLFI